MKRHPVFDDVGLPADTDGPRDLTDTFHWFARSAARLDDFQVACLRRVFDSGPLFSTAYSGAGFMEAIMGHIAEQTSATPQLTRCYDACDVAKHCQRTLCAHTGPAAPEHVHTDITLRFDPRVVEHARTIQRAFALDVEGMVASGIRRSKVLHTLGTQMLDAIDSALIRRPMLHEGPCVKCRTICAFRPSWVTGDHIVGHAAGSTCRDFSAAGKRLGSTGVHTIVFCCWGLERKAFQEDWLLHECTPDHPSELLLARYLGETHFIWSFIIDPSMGGYPLTRKRRITVAVKRAWCLHSVPVLMCPSTPLDYFRAALVTDGMIFWSASREDLDVARVKLGGRPGQAFEELLPAGYRQHLQDNRSALLTQSERLPCHVWDLKDTAAYSHGARRHLRCLLTKSHPWCHEMERSLLPAEALQAMGLPAFATTAAQLPVRNPFISLVLGGGLTDCELRSLCGNGFHVPTVGVVVIWLLALPVWAQHWKI